MKRLVQRGVTLLELLVVLVIISILSTVAVGIYGKEVLRAKYTRARSEIRTMEIAITRYELDTGQLPPSGSGDTIAPAALVETGLADGTGYLQMALRSSLNGSPSGPLSRTWKGSYIDWDYNKLGLINGTPLTEVVDGASLSPGLINFLDPFGGAYVYIRADDYILRGGTEIPTGMAFAATETYFNPSTYQIYSYGPDLSTSADPSRGLGTDDVTNFFSASY
jgi:prepilin-type N-terminal cleavage/methylation domain-containing protein